MLSVSRCVFFILLLALSVMAHATGVVSENLVFLKEDGRSYLLQRTFRTGWDQYNFYLDKEIGPADIYYVDPPEHDWVLDQHEVNILKFKTGNFTVMYPGSYGERVTVDGQGIYTLDTHNGVVREDGHFGKWNNPGNFTRFVQAWVFPEEFRILDYKSNREGEWIEQNNTLTFYATDVNDLTFTVRYQLIDSDGDGVADVNDRCRDTAAGVVVDEAGCVADSDHDGVLDKNDRCAGTPEGAAVDARGCELDSDADGVVDSQDECPNTVAGAEVTRKGCELDCDADGVVDSQDQCPHTPANRKVNAQGCETDSDGDGVANSQDECPHTPAGMPVNAQGCEMDSDGDGVVDSQDECPDTPAGAVVNVHGCGPDADGDGVVDASDQCPGTPAGQPVDALGCVLDGDGDGVLDTADLCPDTAAGVTVDVTGCDAAKPIELRGVQFHFNSDELTDESKVILDKVATTLLKHPDLVLEVAGHTDAEGDDAFNLDLSQRRAASVRNYLVDKGVDANNLSAHGYGEERPVASNDIREGRALNRRVELIRQGQ